MMMVPANTLFARVGLDLAGPFPMTQKGNRHILNIVCWFTKYVVSIPVPDAKSTTVAQAFFTNCYLKFGGCVELVTDNATAFTSEFFREFCSLLYINKKYATPHWSQGNAATERTFRTFHNILAKYITKNQPDFDEFLDAVCFCYNTSVHSSTASRPSSSCSAATQFSAWTRFWTRRFVIQWHFQIGQSSSRNWWCP